MTGDDDFSQQSSIKLQTCLRETITTCHRYSELISWTAIKPRYWTWQQQHLQHQRAIIQPKHQQRQRQILKHWEYAVIQPPAVNCYNVQQNQLHHQQHDISHAVCTRRFSRYRTLWSTTWLIRFSQHSSIPRIMHTITLLFCSQFGGGFAVAKRHESFFKPTHFQLLSTSTTFLQCD